MSNLPADLPENWTQGQIISPNGTEVGLTAQHGYNYLMAQVNAAQTAINNIVESLGEVAQETSVQDILSLIGATADTGATDTTGTLMGKSNAILDNVGNIDAPVIKYMGEKILVQITTSAQSGQSGEMVFNFNSGARKIKEIWFSTSYTPSSSLYIPISISNIKFDVDGTVHNYNFQTSDLAKNENYMMCLLLPSATTVRGNKYTGQLSAPNYVLGWIPFSINVENEITITIPYITSESTSYDINFTVNLVYVDE